MYSCRVKADGNSDVHDFGVILMEIITGTAITSENDVSVIKDLVNDAL